MEIECERINKLILELSQVITAITKKESEMRELLEEANQLLRSTHSIAEREGVAVNWEPFRQRVREALDKQHRFFYPNQYSNQSATEGK